MNMPGMLIGVSDMIVGKCLELRCAFGDSIPVLELLVTNGYCWPIHPKAIHWGINRANAA